MDSISIKDILEALVLIGAAVVVLISAMKPFDDNKQTINEHERKLNNDNERMNRIESKTDAQSLALIQIMNHMIDGNHVDKLKEARDELQRNIIENN